MKLYPDDLSKLTPWLLGVCWLTGLLILTKVAP